MQLSNDVLAIYIDIIHIFIGSCLFLILPNSFVFQAMKVINKFKLSAAIFAQAWCYQFFGGYDFFSLDNRFWHSLSPYLLFHGPTKLPIDTSFCTGFGKKTFMEGLVCVV